MTRHKKYPCDTHTGNVTIPRWEYDSLLEIARLHRELLNRVEKVLPDVHKDFKNATRK